MPVLHLLASVVVSFSAAALPSTDVVGTDVIVNTTAGAILGTSHGDVHVFRGIPYAEPPVDALRWRDPVPKANWTGVRSALADGPGCPQLCKLPILACPPRTAEDCLYLNVFAPANASDLAVMFFVHGGDFYQGFGGGILYDGYQFASRHGVVLVSINYRLGALGFLYSGDDASKEYTGNFGLHDQRLAMRWAQANVARFGGDPNKVTIFGESAGGMSVACHLLMRESHGLFSQAIIESEPFGLPFRTSKTYPSFSATLARKAKCAGALQKKGWEPCMRALNVSLVLEAQAAAEKDLFAEVGHFLDTFIPFSPVVGPTVGLTVQPLQGFVTNRSVADVPLMVGVNRHESLLFIYEAFSSKLSKVEEDAVLGVIFGVSTTVTINKRYPRTAAQKAAHDYRNHSVNITNDCLFRCATRHAALSLTKQRSQGVRASPTFLYHFDHVISFGSAFWLPSTPVCVDAVCHGEELPFVFDPNTSSVNRSFTADEAALALSMQTYWSNFAKSGAPGVAAGVAWPELNAANESAIHLRGAGGNVVDHAVYADRCEFWDGLGYEWVLNP